jgi:hypothetical protein
MATATPTETRTYRVLFQHDDGDTFLLLVDGHDMDDAMAFRGVRGARAVSAVEIPGSARPLGRRSA